MNPRSLCIFLVLFGFPIAGYLSAARADTVQARCDIYPAGDDHAVSTEECMFSQRQGFVSITRRDGARLELAPVNDVPGLYVDERGAQVRREMGLGDQGLIFHFPKFSIFVYWNPVSAEADDPDNPTRPFSTRDYDATTLLKCRRMVDAEFSTCPAGILRMDGGQASIVVQGPDGDRFTINFMSDYINATNREAVATLDADTWTVKIDGREIYEVPIAAIEGG